MTKYKIKLNSEQEKRLKYILDEKSKKDSKTKKRATVILLRNEGKSIKEIIQTVGFSKGIVIKCLKMFLEKGIAGVYCPPKYKRSNLENLKDEIKLEFKNNPFLTYAEASERIEHLYGIKISESAIRRYLLKNKITTSKKVTLEELKDKIVIDFKNNAPCTYKEAAKRLKKKFDIDISESTTRRYLLKIGLDVKKNKR